MPKILIDILPARGHFNGSLKIAQLSKNAGYEVLYLNMGQMKAEMNKYGFQTCSSTAFMDNPVLLNKRKFSFKVFIDKLLSNREQIENNETANFELFHCFLNELSPDLVLLDEQNMLKAIFYEMCNIPVICVETKPEPCKFENAPPFTSFFVPSDTLMSRWICRFLWVEKVLLNRYRLKKWQLNFASTDNYSMASKLALQNGINLKKRTDLHRGYGIGINGIPRLIAALAAFDFPHRIKEGVYNIGPLVNIDREGEIEKPRYNVLRKKLMQYRKTQSGFIIYCSLGTITASFQKKVLRFLKKIRKVAQQNPSDLFVLSTGKGFDVSEMFPAPDNLYLFDYVPQVNLLQYCDIMITHGGINSITECVFNGVPTLNYPLSLEWDQPGCATRTVYHHIGLMGNINKDSVEIIQKKLNHIKSDYTFFRKNVLSMKKKFEEKNNSDEVIEIINKIIIF
jgi:UDP:flavonoid glycosyltransferase YjiC (YdhE family)